jgi:hypothetical protein
MHAASMSTCRRASRGWRAARSHEGVQPIRTSLKLLRSALCLLPVQCHRRRASGAGVCLPRRRPPPADWGWAENLGPRRRLLRPRRTEVPAPAPAIVRRPSLVSSSGVTGACTHERAAASQRRSVCLLQRDRLAAAHRPLAERALRAVPHDTRRARSRPSVT